MTKNEKNLIDALNWVIARRLFEKAKAGRLKNKEKEADKRFVLTAHEKP